MKRFKNWVYLAAIVAIVCGPLYALALTYSGTFSADGEKTELMRLKPNQKATYSIAADLGTEEVGFIGTVILEKTTNGFFYDTIREFTGTVASPLDDTDITGSYVNTLTGNDVQIRFRLDNIDDENTSDPVEYSLASAANTFKEAKIVDGVVEHSNGTTLMRFTDEEVEIPILTGTSIGFGVLLFPSATSPSQTTDAQVVWDTNDDLLTVGTGSGRKTMLDTNSTQTGITGKTFVSPALTSPTLTAQATDAAIGAVAAPGSGTTAVTIARVGNLFTLTFTLTAARISVTDDGVSGSFGALKLFDFVESGLSFLGCRQNFTAYAVDGTGVPDDAVFEIGVGNTAISAAADGVLASGEDNVCGDVDQTLVSGTTTGAGFTGSGGVFDGTGTAGDLYLNWSGTADTVDANGTIDVSATLTVNGILLGDD